MFYQFLAGLPGSPTLWQWIVLAFGSLLIGMDKAGLRGIGIIAVPLYAGILGARMSTGVLLPLLLVGDVCALVIYRNKVAFSYLKKMLPMTLVGIVAGMFLGNYMPDRMFTLFLACIVSLCLILMVYKEIKGSELHLPDHWAAHSGAGLLGGLSTMIGNAAGPIMAAYLLALDLPKTIFIGTGAVFFFIVNVLKLPVHIFFWGTMRADTLVFSLTLAPFIFLGINVGFFIVKIIPDRPFRYFVLVATAAGTVRLFL